MGRAGILPEKLSLVSIAILLGVICTVWADNGYNSMEFQRRIDAANYRRMSNWFQRYIYDSELDGSVPGSRSIPFINRWSRSLGRRRNPFASALGGLGLGLNPNANPNPKYPKGRPGHSHANQELEGEVESYPGTSYRTDSTQQQQGTQYYQEYQEKRPSNKKQYPDCGKDYTKFDQRCCWEEENFMRTQIKKEEEMGYVVAAGSYYYDENRDKCLMSVAETPMAVMNDIEDRRVCKAKADCSWFPDSGTCQCNPQLVGKRVYRGSSYKIYKPPGRWS